MPHVGTVVARLVGRRPSLTAVDYSPELQRKTVASVWSRRHYGLHAPIARPNNPLAFESVHCHHVMFVRVSRFVRTRLLGSGELELVMLYRLYKSRFFAD